MDLASRIAALLDVDVAAATRMHGGDLSAVHRVTLADGSSLVAKESPHAATEAAMLRAIASSGAPAPEVIACDEGLIVMEWLCADGSLGSAWGNLAQVLLTLHGCHGASYGWPDDYAFGSVDISNEANGDWPAFWAERRLLCHLRVMPAPLARRIERLSYALQDLLPRTPAPSLLHGDLWGGNILVSNSAVAGLIDPACYHGDREVDAAMLTLFDHPPASFFDALDLEPGWRERQPVYRLWPWLVHLRLFGSGYRTAVESCLVELGA